MAPTALPTTGTPAKSEGRAGADWHCARTRRRQSVNYFVRIQNPSRPFATTPTAPTHVYRAMPSTPRLTLRGSQQQGQQRPRAEHGALHCVRAARLNAEEKVPDRSDSSAASDLYLPSTRGGLRFRLHADHVSAAYSSAADIDGIAIFVFGAGCSPMPSVGQCWPVLASVGQWQAVVDTALVHVDWRASTHRITTDACMSRPATWPLCRLAAAPASCCQQAAPPCPLPRPALPRLDSNKSGGPRWWRVVRGPASRKGRSRGPAVGGYTTHACAPPGVPGLPQ